MDDDLHRLARCRADEPGAPSQARPGQAAARALMVYRLDGFRRFNEWERREQSYPRFEVALRSLDELRRLASQDTRNRAFDLEQAGVRRMHEVLDHLSRTTLSTRGPR